MAVEEQVAVIYCGVRGHLDKVDPTKITKFEKDFLAHIRVTEKDLLARIAKEGSLSPESDAALKKVVLDFMSSWSASA